MEHINEEDLVLHYYGEARNGAGIEDHLNGCHACRSRFQELSVSIANLDLFTVPERGDDYGAQIWRRLRLQERQAPSGSRWNLRPALRWAQAGWVAALLLVGFLLGRYLPGPEREELRAMRELLTLSLLNQQSASERLAGVSWSRNLQQPDAKVLGALVQALESDPDVNVRLAAVDALSRYSTQSLVKDQLVNALGRQTSPMVQIALIDLLVELGEKRSADTLRRLANDEKTNQYVRQRAEWGLKQVS
jgi:hypothetical protein